MLKNSKWRSRVIVRARASEVVDEYSDPLEVAASTGATLSTPEKAGISRKRIRFL